MPPAKVCLGRYVTINAEGVCNLGKTLGTLLEVAGFAAFAVVTAGVGVGLEAGLSVTAALGSISVAGLGAGGLIASGLAALTLGEGLLAKSPRPAATEGTQKIAIPPRVSGYGLIRADAHYRVA